MNGPQHYTEAEKILAEVAGFASDVPDEAVASVDAWLARSIAQAQVHATLALVAAAMEDDVANYTGADTSTMRAWGKAIS